MLYWNVIFKMFIPRIFCNTTLWICWHYLRKSFNFSHYVTLIKPRPRRSSRVFLYVRISLLSCNYLVFFPDILRSLFFAFEHVQGVAEVWSKCHRSKEKGTVTKDKSLFVGDLEICCSVFKALSILTFLSLTIHDSTQFNRKTIITTKVLSLL